MRRINDNLQEVLRRLAAGEILTYQVKLSDRTRPYRFDRGSPVNSRTVEELLAQGMIRHRGSHRVRLVVAYNPLGRYSVRSKEPE